MLLFPLVFIVAALVGFGAWWLYNRSETRQTDENPEQSSRRTHLGSKAQFCGECGVPLAGNERFCGKCGTEVIGT